MEENFNATALTRIYYTEVHLKELQLHEHDSSVLADKFGLQVDRVIYDQDSRPFGIRFSGPMYKLRNMLATIIKEFRIQGHFDPEVIDDRIHYKVQEVTHGRQVL